MSTEIVQPEQEYTQAFRERVHDLDGWQCQITGQDDELHCCHIEHRGMGGDDSKNIEGNCITLSALTHDRLDGRTDPFTHPWLHITHWDRNDPENGLVVETKRGFDGQWETVAKDELWFYKRPNPLKADRYFELLSEAQGISANWERQQYRIAQIVTEIKRDELYRAQGYTSLAEAVHGDFRFLLPDGATFSHTKGWLAKITLAMEVVEQIPDAQPELIEALPQEVTPEQAKEAIYSGFSKESLYQASQVKDPVQRAEVLRAIVVEREPTTAIIERVKQIKHPNAQAIQSCFDCIHAETLGRGKRIQVGDDQLTVGQKGITVCRQKNRLISSMTSGEAQDVAGGNSDLEACPHFKRYEKD